MRFQRILLPVVAAVLLTGCLSFLARAVPSHNQMLDTSGFPGGLYQVDSQHATLLFNVDHMGYSRTYVRFRKFAADMMFDPERPEESSLQVTVDAASLDANDDEFNDTLTGKNFFAVDRFPEITFTATNLEILSESDGKLTGDLTLRGVTHPLTLDVKFNGGAVNFLTGRFTMGFSARGHLVRSEYDFDELLPLVGDEVDIIVEVEFQHQPNAKS